MNQISSREQWVMAYNIILATIVIAGIYLTNTGWPVACLALFMVVRTVKPERKDEPSIQG